MRIDVVANVLPKQLKKYRSDLNMSQEDVADKLFVSRQAVSRWESGDATPDLTNLIKLTEIFKCSLDSLVLGIEEKAPQVGVPEIDSNEFTFDPRRGEYVRRHKNMNFWDFVASYWWLIFPVGAFLSWFIPEIINAFR
ncbi:helix-turn-helix domain-containing protein [Leuconostoc gelidum]|uniref:helix-turn-helix domain-containing protein n=1 Tax=Leuconostoc gelidum TaxID=1244 RepID=UPI001C7DD70D|nr:helix-turn-helix transcriptional regulator [Leuconostoc gelidum]MBZ6010146.1 helix-turn-helix transcriptional regulator [Leuconostoc gelidum subsp. aenigmaticum]